jgi:opacity protein-like surface antigen
MNTVRFSVVGSRWLTVAAALVALTSAAFAGPEIISGKESKEVMQTAPPEDYNKVEFYGGYSYANVDPNVETLVIAGQPLDPCSSAGAAALGSNFQDFFCDRRSYNGFDTSITYNFTRYFGITGNLTGHYKSDRFVDPDSSGIGIDTIDTTESIYNFLVGLQVKDNRKSARFKPFAHVLLGAAYYTGTEVQTSTAPNNNFTTKDNVTSFAMKVGGGIDVRVHRNIDIRLVEVDYNPIFAGDHSPEAPFPLAIKGRTANNFTAGTGIVIHF